MTSILVASYAALLAALALLVTLKILRGDINSRGLLANRPRDVVAPERLQAIVVSLGIPLFYVAAGISAIGTDPPRLPDVPDWMLVLATGSQGIYVGGKVARRAAEPAP